MAMARLGNGDDRLAVRQPFMELVHAEDERIPVDALEFGTSAIGRLLERFAKVAPAATAA